MTHQQKINDLRRKAMEIIERGLSDEESSPTSFSNAVILISYAPPEFLLTEMPDVLDAEEIEVENDHA